MFVISKSYFKFLGLIGVTVFGNPQIIIVSLIIGTFLNMLYALFVMVKKLKFKIRFAYDKQIARAIIAYLPGFAVTGIVIKILNSLDVVLIKSIGANYETVALYSIPLKLINAISMTLPIALMGALYPAFAHLHEKSEESLNAVFQKAVEYLMILSIPIAVGFMMLGDELIKSLWNQEYYAAINPGKVMLFSLPFIFLAFPTGNLLNATGRQKHTAISRCIGVLVMAISYVALISYFDVMGAAFALVITHATIFISDAFFLRSRFIKIGNVLIKQLGKTAIASLAMAGVIFYGAAYIPWYMLALLSGAADFFFFFFF